MMKQLESVFNPLPPQFGLRGDKALWELLSTYSFSDSLNAIEEIRLAYNSIVVQGVKKGGGEGVVFIEFLYAYGGGMSSGYVYTKWWDNVGLPLIFERVRSLFGGVS
jgi:hypothetical protein